MQACVPHHRRRFLSYTGTLKINVTTPAPPLPPVLHVFTHAGRDTLMPDKAPKFSRGAAKGAGFNTCRERWERWGAQCETQSQHIAGRHGDSEEGKGGG